MIPLEKALFLSTALMLSEGLARLILSRQNWVCQKFLSVSIIGCAEIKEHTYESHGNKHVNTQ